MICLWIKMTSFIYSIVGRADMYDPDLADAACQEVASALREQVASLTFFFLFINLKPRVE